VASELWHRLKFKICFGLHLGAEHAKNIPMRTLNKVIAVTADA
jgi:hypothetical protein